MDFSNSKQAANTILAAGRKMSQGKSMAEVGIAAEYMVAYGEMSERADRDRRYALTRYRYEMSGGSRPSTGGVLISRIGA